MPKLKPWPNIFDRLKRRRASTRAAEALHAAAVRQARLAGFYRDWGVPDTLDGRFDLLVLHLFLLLRRLKAEGEAGRALAQRLFDISFEHFDQSLREMGVGDLSVGRKIKAMGAAVYGRSAAYEATLEAGGQALAEALGRNLYAQPPAPEVLAALADYAHAAARALAAQPGARLLAGEALFPPPPVAPSASKR